MLPWGCVGDLEEIQSCSQQREFTETVNDSASKVIHFGSQLNITAYC